MRATLNPDGPPPDGAFLFAVRPITGDDEFDFFTEKPEELPGHAVHRRRKTKYV